MSHLISRGLAIPATALRAGWMVGLAACALVACNDLDLSGHEPPEIRPIAVEVVEDTSVEVQLAADGFGTLAFAIVEAPVHGSVSELRPDGTITYTPNADYQGEDAFTFRAVDHWGTSAQGKVSITVTPVGDAPTISEVANQSISSGRSTGELAFTVGDVDTAVDALTVTATSSTTEVVPNDAAHLVVGGSGANRTINVIPVGRGTTTITLSVSDGSATKSTTFTVEVTGSASLYWVTAPGALWRADVGGTNAVELKTGIGANPLVATDPVARTVYYKDGAAIVRVDADGANAVTVVANGGLPSGMLVDTTHRKLYWSDFNGRRVMRAELDGSNPEQIVSGFDSPSALAVDAPNGKLYVISYNNTILARANLDGTGLQTLATGLGGQGVGLAVDSSTGKLYYALRGNSLFVSNLDGSNRTALVTGQTTVHGVAIDPSVGRVYWVDWLGQAVKSANLADGSDIQTVNAGSARNVSLAWMPAP